MSVQDGVEAIYPLTAAQNAWLIHSLHRAGDDPGFQQNRATLRGPLNLDQFAQAWQTVTERHAALRTSFHWRGLDRAVQVIHRQVAMPFTVERWWPPAQDLEPVLEEYLEADRRRGFEFETAPLMRVAVIRTGEVCYELVWSLHHLLMDGWSTALVCREVWTVYEGLRKDDAPRLSTPPPFPDYLRWLARQELGPAEVYWRDRLRDAPSVRPATARPEGSRRLVCRETEFSEEISSDLTATARRYRLTPSSVLFGAWALVLGRWRNAADVMFGTTVSGRSPEIHRVGEIVGLMQHTIPVRVRIAATTPLVDWLREIQTTQIAATAYQHAPLEQIIRWSGLPAGARLFDNLLVFENYPTGLPTDLGGTEVQDVRGAVTSVYPLNLIIIPGPRYRLQLHYDPLQVTADEIDWLERAWRIVVQRVVTSPEAELRHLLGQVSVWQSATRSTESPPADDSRGDRGGSIRTLAERRVAQIWGEELGVQDIDPSNSFFDLGGYSLVAIRALDRMREELGVKLDLEDLVFQTLRQVAAKCDHQAAVDSRGAHDEHRS